MPTLQTLLLKGDIRSVLRLFIAVVFFHDVVDYRLCLFVMLTPSYLLVWTLGLWKCFTLVIAFANSRETKWFAVNSSEDSDMVSGLFIGNFQFRKSN